MPTRFADEARERLDPVMSADLATYIDGIGEMFREIEEYAREDDGPIEVGPISDPIDLAKLRTTADPWWFYYSRPTRGDVYLDTSITHGGEPTYRITRLDTVDRVGIAYQGLPVKVGETYVIRGAFRPHPNQVGASFLVQHALYELPNASGGSTITNTLITAEEGWNEFEFACTVPANRAYLWSYVLGSLTGLDEFHVSGDLSIYRRSKATMPIAPWAKITNPEAAINEAALLYLAQLAGVHVPSGLAFRDMQSFIERADARRRGRLDYMVELAQATLTGTKQVITVERVTSAWTLRILTRASETPNPAATEAAILRGKPAGIILDYEAVAGITWDEAVSQWNSATITWDESLNTVP